jgi:hypothetical protein
MSPARALPSGAGIDLYWIPLGAGSRVVPRCGRAFERLVALREHRPPRPLFHAALEVTLDGVRHAIEMGPAWGAADPGRRVVRRGPVGLRPLGRLPVFRYEVRCWPYGIIPDLSFALESRRLSRDPAQAARALALVDTVPALIWGRDELGLGEMWNSNSLVAWLLARSGVDPTGLAPPDGGRAPGWGAGIALAHRDQEGPRHWAPEPRDVGLCRSPRPHASLRP